MSVLGIDIDQSQVCIIKEGASKHEALERLIEVLSQNPAVTDCAAFRRAVFEREAVMSTGIGGGIAIPHVRIPEITKTVVGLGVAPGGIDFGTLDNQSVFLLVLFATPKGAEKEYLRVLAQVMAALRRPELCAELRACRTPADIAAVLNA